MAAILDATRDMLHRSASLAKGSNAPDCNVFPLPSRCPARQNLRLMLIFLLEMFFLRPLINQRGTVNGDNESGNCQTGLRNYPETS